MRKPWQSIVGWIRRQSRRADGIKEFKQVNKRGSQVVVLFIILTTAKNLLFGGDFERTNLRCRKRATF